MFIGGGWEAKNSVECFSLEKQEWIGIMPTTEDFCELSSWNGKLVATGGEEGFRKGSNYVETYDDMSGNWFPLPSMNKGRFAHGVCTTKDNQLIVVGGVGALYSDLNSVECLKM